MWIKNKLNPIQLGAIKLGIDTTKNKKGIITKLRFHKSNNEYIDFSFYESGFKKSLKRVKNRQCEGKYFDWYENGKIQWKREYDKGHQIGLNITFHENGQKKQEYNSKTEETTWFFENGKPSELNSSKKRIFFYDNGNKFEEFIHKFDSNNEIKNSGFVNIYNENGTKVFEGEYDNKFYYKNGEKFTGEIICYFLDAVVYFPPAMVTSPGAVVATACSRESVLVASDSPVSSGRRPA